MSTASRHARIREPRFSFLPRRKGQPEAPQAPVVPFAGAPDAGPMLPSLPAPVSDETVVFRVPSPDGDGFDLPPGAPWQADPAAPLPVRTPGAAFPPDLVPVLRTEPADPDLLLDVIDGLKALPDEPAPLPATLLRAVPRDGGEGSSKEILSGWPACSGGMRTTEAGIRVAGLCIGDASDVLVYIENPSAEWWDEFIAEAVRTRDLQVYGGFPAGEPAPAAEAEAVTDAEDGEAA